MRKIGWALVGATALLISAACSDRSDPVAPGRMSPRGSSRDAAPLESTQPKTGAIYTTDGGCTGVNVNIFGSKSDVYLDGGPNGGGSGLPDGNYAVKVTDPSGAIVLGTTIGSTDDRPVVVSGGEFSQCYQLATILIKGSDQTAGYDDTPNPGGEYKVWVSNGSDFVVAKTDNFKVNSVNCDPETDICGPPPSGTLSVVKFYDANANGVQDGTEPFLNGWRIRIQDGIDFIRFTPVALIVDPDDYTVTESNPIQLNWIHTTTNPVTVTVLDGGAPTVTFGNVCTGAGGGLTLGFWSNRNGQALETAADFVALTALHLRNANGTDRDFVGSLAQNKSALNSWLLSATATNMANMLSAQLAAMTLNVAHGFVNGNALIYAPGTPSANALGFATVNAVMADAEAQLTANPVTVAAGTNRTIQEAIKNALDKANNNLNFVQGTPCAFSFAE